MRIGPATLDETQYLSMWLSISFSGAPLKKVLQKITSLTGVEFSYSESEVRLGKSISVDANHVTLAEALNEVFDGTGLRWMPVAGGYVIITESKGEENGSGTLTGKVVDRESKVALPGATVLVKGTSIGAATDLNGKFTIHNVPSGEQTIVISYVGYTSATEVVNVPANQTVEKDFLLSSIAVKSKEVVVTAQAQGQMQAINQQLSSDKIINVVSADKIRELPDANASEALSRLPGVSIMNGDQIVIRGMQAKDNVILMNGVQLPSTDLNTRAVDLGFISSNMLSSIEVIKTVTPDMDANALGGVVNLRLMQAPQNFHLDVLTQGNYNAQARTADNYRLWGSVSDRFLDNKLGVFIQGNADRTDGGNDQTTAGYSVNTDYKTYQTYQMNNFTWDQQANITTNYGGSLILDYSLPRGKITLQNTLTRNLNDNIDYEYLAGLAGQQTGLLNFTVGRDKFNRDLDVNALEVENDFGLVKVDLTLSHSFSNQYTDIRYGDSGDFFGFTNSTSNEPFLDANGNPVNMTNLIGRAAFLTPADMMQLQVNPPFAQNADLENWATLRWNNFAEHFYNSALNFTIPVVFSPDVSAAFKFGGKVDRITRVNNLEEDYKRTGDADMYKNVQNFIPGTTLTNLTPLRLGMIMNNDFKRGQYFLNDSYDIRYVMNINQMDNFLPQAASGWVNPRHVENSTRYDFNGAEIYTAGYLMGTFNIGSRLTVLGGARFEHYNMNYQSHFVYVTHSVDGTSIIYDTTSAYRPLFDSLGLASTNRNDDNLLPNIQLRYKVTDWFDLRLAYTNTLVRPDYNAIMPNVLFEPGNYGEAGNPELKPTLSQNYDAGLSFYNNDIGLLTLDGFYKHMDNVFFFTTIYYQNLGSYNAWFPDSAVWKALGLTGTGAPSQSTPIQTYLNNPYPAHVYGLELDWQTRFWYLPGPLSYLVFDINYTHVWSNMDYQQLTNIDSTYTYTDPATHRTKIGNVYLTKSTVRNARLVNQSNDVLNVSVGADYMGFSGRVSFNLQGNVITSVSSTTAEGDQFTGNIYIWDIALRHHLPMS
ncbi:MAG: TonB-dependent receptor, partial [Bacteroidetes bacterium]|nr:TonB-dependent receptor [Bacteroidota bacterium]